MLMLLNKAVFVNVLVVLTILQQKSSAYWDYETLRVLLHLGKAKFWFTKFYSILVNFGKLRHLSTLNVRMNFWPANQRGKCA